MNRWGDHGNRVLEPRVPLTLIMLTWSVGLAPNNASRWQMGFNSAFKGLNAWNIDPYILFLSGR
jgi:hypothetical protein